MPNCHPAIDSAVHVHSLVPPCTGTGVAINAAQYGGSQACGLCVAYRGTGSGLGNSPIPTTYQYAQGQP